MLPAALAEPVQVPRAGTRVTMTGELCDASRRSGRSWARYGRGGSSRAGGWCAWVEQGNSNAFSSRQYTLVVAAANWTRWRRLPGRFVSGGGGLLIDIRLTTTDISRSRQPDPPRGEGMTKSGSTLTNSCTRLAPHAVRGHQRQTMGNIRTTRVTCVGEATGGTDNRDTADGRLSEAILTREISPYPGGERIRRTNDVEFAKQGLALVKRLWKREAAATLGRSVLTGRLTTAVVWAARSWPVKSSTGRAWSVERVVHSKRIGPTARRRACV